MMANLLALVFLFSSLVPAERPAPLGDMVTSRRFSSLAMRLQREPAAVTRDESRRAAAIFGLPADEARMLLFAVDRHRPLPEGYSPPDLISAGGRQVRGIMLDDLQAMVEAAATEQIELAPISAYRSPDEQELAFESAIWGAMARGASDRAEAESSSLRYVAPPGRSQHQLGTAVDFSTWEINYAIQPGFAETAAGNWLRQRGWEYGFVLPYPSSGEQRTGYAYEPWHWRWIGRGLAAVMQHDRYLDHPTIVADDYLRAAEEILDAEGIP